jgi:stage II sporulation protein M
MKKHRRYQKIKPLTIKTQFSEATKYIKKSSKFIYISIILFIMSAIFGFLFAENLTFIDNLLREIILRTENLSATELTVFILQNNLQSALFSIIFGVFLGFLPFTSAIGNGIVLGYVFNLTYQVTGIADFWRILPHGIFELPAIFIAIGLGIKWGNDTLANFFYINKKNNPKKLLGIFSIIFLILATLITLSLAPTFKSLSLLPIAAAFFIFFIASIILFLSLFVLSKKTIKFHKKTVYELANVYLMIILPLLIIAAIIEGVLIAITF